MVRLLFCAGLAMSLLMGTGPAWAHNFTWDISELQVGETTIYPEHHEDTGEYAGFVEIKVTNTGSEAWGSFHMEFTEVRGYSISNLDWIADESYSSTQTVSRIIEDNNAYGATLDFYFSPDPLLPGETGWFYGKANNQDEVAYFGVMAYPLPVPTPSSGFMLGSGLLGFVCLARKK